jgi:hypothetical protein
MYLREMRFTMEFVIYLKYKTYKESSMLLGM